MYDRKFKIGNVEDDDYLAVRIGLQFWLCLP